MSLVLRNRWLRVIAACTALLCSVLAAVALHAGSAGAASGDPSYYPDPDRQGDVTLYDATGHQITGGSLTAAPLAAYYVGSGKGIHTTEQDIGAQQAFCTPQDGVPPVNWSTCEIETAASIYPDPTFPGAVGTTQNAVAAGSSSDGTLASHIAFAKNASAKDPGIYEIRVYTANADEGTSTDYYSTVVRVDPTAGTWTQVNPPNGGGSTPAATTTTLTADSTTTVQGAPVTLTATVSPAAATGSVQFSDGSTKLGAAVAVSGGKATTSVSSLTAGSHTLTATFTPASTDTYSASTSAGLTHTVTTPAVTTTTTLSVSPSQATVGQTSTLTATVAPAGAAGTVQFYDGAATLSTPVAVSSGTATLSRKFDVNTHNLSAVFTPADSAAFTASTSKTVSYVVSDKPLIDTTTTLAVSPTGAVESGAKLTLTATESPAAAGTVSFTEDGTQIASAPVTGGTATASLTTLAAGTHPIVATFTPTDQTTYRGSASATVSVTVTKPPAAKTTTTLAVSPTGSIQAGNALQLTATLDPTTAVGTVQFYDGTKTIGDPVAVSGGMASASASDLTVGTHQITAAFVPADATDFAASTSAATAVTVTRPPATAGSVGLTTDPAGKAVKGGTVALTATLTPSTATGTVDFLDGTTVIASGVDVVNGVASTSTKDLGLGDHQLVAKFTSSDAGAVTDATSNVASLTVIPPPTDTTTTLTADHATVDFGAPVSLTATVVPATADGTVTFFDGGTALSTVAVSGGSATLSTSALAGGRGHAITATFTPADSEKFAQSTSDPVTVTVNAPPASATQVSLAVGPGSTLTRGGSMTFTATVTPSAAVGSVAFLDGTTPVGSSVVSNGTASFSTTGLAVGQHSITAVFTPTDPAAYKPSTSNAQTVAIVAPPTIAAVSLNGQAIQANADVPRGALLAMKVVGFQPDEVVTVTLHSTPVTLGKVVAGPDGSVVAAITLNGTTALGKHTLTFAGGLGSVSFDFTLVSSSTDATTSPTPSPSASAAATSASSGTASATPSAAVAAAISSGSSSGLATTGSNASAGLMLAGAFILLGGGVLVLTRRRRKSAAH